MSIVKTICTSRLVGALFNLSFMNAEDKVKSIMESFESLEDCEKNSLLKNLIQVTQQGRRKKVDLHESELQQTRKNMEELFTIIGDDSIKITPYPNAILSNGSVVGSNF